VCAGLAREDIDEDSLPYRYRIEVIWDGAIYAADYSSLSDGVTKCNKRSWTSATSEAYRRVVDRILAGKVVRRAHDAPRLPWEQRRATAHRRSLSEHEPTPPVPRHRVDVRE
jgi:hypothetical protein